MFARMSRYGPVAGGISGSRSPGLPYSPAGHSTAWHDAPLAQLAEQQTLNPRVRGSSPGGAPVLTWAYARSGSSREGRFGAMVAPRLLVSPDLVPRAALAGLATARFRPPSVLSRPQHPLQSDPTDGITQREAAWLLPCGFTLRPWTVSTGLRPAGPPRRPLDLRYIWYRPAMYLGWTCTGLSPASRAESGSMPVPGRVTIPAVRTRGLLSVVLAMF